MDILDKPLLRSLLNKDIPFYEVMNAFNIKTTIAFNIPASILGFVYLSRRQNYHLILNGNINYETQCHVFLHEIKHITEDIPNIGYIIGLDMQCTYMELSADNVANKLYSIKWLTQFYNFEFLFLHFWENFVIMCNIWERMRLNGN